LLKQKPKQKPNITQDNWPETISPDIKDIEPKSWKNIMPPSDGSETTETDSSPTTWD
jgi:hypothetical protein